MHQPGLRAGLGGDILCICGRHTCHHLLPLPPLITAIPATPHTSPKTHLQLLSCNTSDTLHRHHCRSDSRDAHTVSSLLFLPKSVLLPTENPPVTRLANCHSLPSSLAALQLWIPYPLLCPRRRFMQGFPARNNLIYAYTAAHTVVHCTTARTWTGRTALYATPRLASAASVACQLRPSFRLTTCLPRGLPPRPSRRH
jgi:hypothetical protein